MNNLIIQQVKSPNIIICLIKVSNLLLLKFIDIKRKIFKKKVGKNKKKDIIIFSSFLFYF